MINVNGPSSSSHPPTYPPSLASLSRNASAISTSSSDSTPSEPHLTPRDRPIRAFSGPRSKSPHSISPRATRPPHYLARELGYLDDGDEARKAEEEAKAKARSKSRGRNTAATVDDFKFGATLGDGSYSTVKFATHLATGKQFAIKVIEKHHLITKKKQSTAHAERSALMTLGAGHPGIVRMWYCFQDQWRLYFVLDLVRNGEMKTLLSRMGSFSLECSRYYGALLVDIVQYMHLKNVIHRDLKPENLLFDDDFRIKITDFGTGKVLESPNDKTHTWVGTAQYIAPELLLAKETSRATDFWALGCVIYQMIAGRFAFTGLSDFLTFEKIKKSEYSFPDGFDADAKDLIQRLLIPNPEERLGVGLPGSNNDMQTLRSHPFFSTIKWETLWTDPVPPLTTGLMKNENPLAKGHDRDWEGIGTTWDDLAVDSDEDDGLEWATSNRRWQAKPDSSGDIGPLGEFRPHSVPVPISGRRDTGSTIHEMDRPMTSINGGTANDGTTRDQAPSESPFSGSPSSSSEGSPAGNLDTMMKSMSVRSSQRNATDGPNDTLNEVNRHEEDERGRKQALSPVQGNGPASDVDFAALLKLPIEETILFNSAVEARSLRRRASRLIPLPVPPSKRKTRQLILTSKRLLCLKQRKAGDISVKSELSLRASEKLKEKDKERESRGIVASVERKGEREFVVLTSSKTYSYAAKDSDLASIWTTNINEALVSCGRQPSKART